MYAVGLTPPIAGMGAVDQALRPLAAAALQNLNKDRVQRLGCTRPVWLTKLHQAHTCLQGGIQSCQKGLDAVRAGNSADRSDEHTSELQSLLRNSYADFC